ncbi:unnamed protein product, partial [Prorocentrum cordatum]
GGTRRAAARQAAEGRAACARLVGGAGRHRGCGGRGIAVLRLRPPWRGAVARGRARALVVWRGGRGARLRQHGGGARGGVRSCACRAAWRQARAAAGSRGSNGINSRGCSAGVYEPRGAGGAVAGRGLARRGVAGIGAAAGRLRVARASRRGFAALRGWSGWRGRRCARQTGDRPADRPAITSGPPKWGWSGL